MYEDIIHFWFEELSAQDQFKKDANLDQLIKDRYLTLHQAATRGELYEWRSSAIGRLAEIIVLDQFSRNIYRDRPEAFMHDTLALALSQEAITRHGVREGLNVQQRAFLYMPFMHSESKSIHEKALELFSEPGLEHNLDYELKHKKIIDRFGRYPHRNAILGRVSTPQEIEFLKEPGSSF